MTADTPPSEEDLHDYVDGRFDHDRRADDTATLFRAARHVFYALTVPRDTVDAVEPSCERTRG